MITSPRGAHRWRHCSSASSFAGNDREVAPQRRRVRSEFPGPSGRLGLLRPPGHPRGLRPAGILRVASDSRDPSEPSDVWDRAGCLRPSGPLQSRQPPGIPPSSQTPGVPQTHWNTSSPLNPSELSDLRDPSRCLRLPGTLGALRPLQSPWTPLEPSDLRDRLGHPPIPQISGIAWGASDLWDSSYLPEPLRALQSPQTRRDP